MKRKRQLYHNDEIDLIELFKIIWNGRIKILLIIAISFLVGAGYSNQIPNNNLISLEIKKNDNSEIKKINSVYKLLESNITTQNIFDKFNKELQDYEEFLLNIRNTKKVKDNISNLPLDIQKKELLKYKNLLNITKNKSDIKLNFKWDNIDEANNILQKTINLTLINLEKSILKDIDLIINDLKNIFQLNHLEKLNTLIDHRWIAKELNISDIPYGYMGEPYYLRGYLAIDKEIELIKKNYSKNFYEKFNIVEEKVNSLKKENLNLIKYNIYSIKIKSLNDTKSILTISVMVGLITGIFFVLIPNIFPYLTVFKKSQTVYKKRIN
jgi:hypothetical protein